MNRSTENDRIFPLTALLILAAGALLRVQTLFGALEYDEIWSLENFSGLPIAKIFTELALPNNQPLNSLWIKFASAAGGPVWSIRLHSLLASLATLPLAGFIAYVLSGRKKAAFLWGMLFLALSVPDVIYAALARGYALQVFFLALYAAGLAACGSLRPQKKYLSYLPEAAVFAGGAGAVLTLPTSVMYLCAITLAAWLIYGKRPQAGLLVVLGAGAILTLAFCLGNYQQLDAARKWGTPLSTWRGFFFFVSGTLDRLFTPGVIPLLAVLMCFLRRRALPVLLVIALPLGAAVLSNAGPDRAYLPFCAAAAVAAGACAAEVQSRLKNKTFRVAGALLFAGVSAALLSIQLPRWRTADWRTVYEKASKEPFSVLVVHRATSGYPLGWNNRPAIYTDFVNRLLDRSRERELVMFDGPGRINGNDSSDCEAVLTVPSAGRGEVLGGLACRRYKLREVSSASPGEAVLIALRPVPSETAGAMLSALGKSGLVRLKLNPWLCYRIDRPEGSYRYALLAGIVPENSAIDLTSFISSAGGAVSVYRFEP